MSATSTHGNEGELRTGGEVKTGLISGRTFENQEVRYTAIEGIAIFEGDIALGTVEQMEENMRRGEVATPAGVGITGENFRWPARRVPFEIDPGLPNPQRVLDAIAHWEQHGFQFVERTAANAGEHPNYLSFEDRGGCWSMVGMQGGEQVVSLGSGCATGNAIHEIGHALGLWHEQSREDRDSFVTIHPENIIPGMEHNFDQHIVDGDDLGPYDYDSIMHYPPNAFSRNGQDTIVPVDPANRGRLGQRRELSAGDIAAIEAMYPVSPAT